MNIMSKLDEETARRLERIRDKFGFSSCYEIMQCLISAFLRYADPGGEPYAQLDQSVVHLSHIFEGLENDLTRAAVGKPGARGCLRLDDIIAIYSVPGSRKRTIRHYTIKADDSVCSSVNESAALDDVLAALYISAASDKNAALAVEQLPKLRGCDLHSTQILYSGDEGTLRKMGIHVTCDPVFPDNSLFI